MTPPPAFRELGIAEGTAHGVVRPEHARRLCDGHFPGDLLVPGAYLAGLMAEVAEYLVAATEARRTRVSELVRCVFLAPVRPDEEIGVTAKIDGRGRIEAEIHAAGACAARATLRLAEVR